MPTQSPSAVRFFAPDHPALAITLRARLEKWRVEALEQVLSATDWGDFCARKGRVQGIDDALQHSIDIEREMVDPQR